MVHEWVESMFLSCNTTNTINNINNTVIDATSVSSDVIHPRAILVLVRDLMIKTIKKISVVFHSCGYRIHFCVKGLIYCKLLKFL